MSKKIIFTAGGTGGHILPAFNLAKYFSEKGYDVLLVTDERGCNFLKVDSKIKLYTLKCKTPTNKNFIKKILSYLIIFFSIIKSAIILRKEKPNLIFGLGGYVSFPLCFSSWFFKIPLIIYENNIVLGRANKVLSFFSRKILIAKNIKDQFLNKYRSKIFLVGPILSKNITNSINEVENNSNNLTITVLGGSQGAKIFGKIIPQVINRTKKEGYNIKINQQSTIDQQKSIIDFYTENNIKNYIFNFEKDVEKLILSSNLVITRCGASSTAELAHTCTPFVAIPLAHSIDNHQYLNAKYYENKGCCWVLEEHNLNTKTLFDLILKIFKDKKSLEKTKNNMKQFNNNDVYQKIENEIKELV